jgi:uroporphyrinogen-III synthase
MVVAVGASTAAALQSRGWPPTLVPSDKRQEGILEALPQDLRGKRFLFPQAAGARELLPEQLRARGAEVEVVPIYETVACRPLPPLPRFDVALFASPSALHSFADWHGVEALRSVPFVVLGPTTAASARALGLSPAAEAAEPSVAGVIAALVGVDRALL